MFNSFITSLYQTCLPVMGHFAMFILVNYAKVTSHKPVMGHFAMYHDETLAEQTRQRNIVY